MIPSLSVHYLYRNQLIRIDTVIIQMMVTAAKTIIIESSWSIISHLTFIQLKPLSHQTAMPQRLYSVLKTCQRTVGSQGNMSKIIKFASNSVYTMSSQRSYSVHTMFPQHPYNVHDASMAGKKLLQRVHGAHTTFWQRSKRSRFF